ncbi:MAG: GNAT family N-acetyltransferase [Chloroflexota bacterium]|nr:GNAT family N-acetyltransferase [Chloroflexota bacterium]
MVARPDPPWVELEPWADTDLDLLRRINAPEMMEHLGGPETEERVLARHQRYLAVADTETGRMFRIVLLPEREAAGAIGYWERVGHGETVYEMGWSVLHRFQGKGIATAAAAAAIAHARAEHKHRYAQAFPSVDHPASSAICRKLGFTFMGASDFEYPPGSVIRCNEWRMDLEATNEVPTPHAGTESSVPRD